MTDLSPDQQRRRLRLPFAVTPQLLIWGGLVAASAGMALIAFSWAKVSALVQVSLQLPYVVSGGLSGVALVVIGMTMVNVGTRRQDAAERAQQFASLDAVLGELRDTLNR